MNLNELLSLLELYWNGTSRYLHSWNQKHLLLQAITTWFTFSSFASLILQLYELFLLLWASYMTGLLWSCSISFDILYLSIILLQSSFYDDIRIVTIHVFQNLNIEVMQNSHYEILEFCFFFPLQIPIKVFKKQLQVRCE